MLVGCGGGGGMGGPGQQQTSIRVGEAAVTYSGTAKPMEQSGSGNVTVTEMAGASFSGVSILPNQTLDNTLIVGIGTGVQTLNPSGTVINTLTSVDPFPDYAAFTNDGHIIFSGINLTTLVAYVYECNWDGSSPQAILGGDQIGALYGMAWAPNNSRVAWVDTGKNLWVSNPDGSNPVMLSSNADYPSFSPDSSTVVFDDVSNSELYFVSAAGGTPTPLPGQVSGTTYAQATYFPSGTAIVYDQLTGSTSTLEEKTPNGTSIMTLGTASGYSGVGYPTVSPDGKQLAYTSNATSGSYLTTSDIYGDNRTYLSLNNAQPFYNPHWSPFPGAQNYVGSGGSMFSSASGFLWAQNGDVQTGFLAFTTSSPKTSAVTQVGGASGGGELVYDVHGSSITGIKYTSGYYSQIVSIPAGSTDVLVSFDSTSGKVENVAPFIRARTAAQPVRQGSDLQFKEHFLGAFDAKGHNLAPNGASQLVLDSKTGKVLRVG